MLVDNGNACAHRGVREDGTNAEAEAAHERRGAENSMVPSFAGAVPCYESFFMDCLSRPDICSVFFVSALDSILEHLLALQSCSEFVQERDLTYFFSGLVFLYAECGCGIFKSRFIGFLSVLFMKREVMYAQYRFLHRYAVFKALLLLVKKSDFRIREFIYNTDFVDVLFELSNDDPMLLMSKWKFVNVVATSAVISSSVLERETVKGFVGNNATTSFGAVNSLIKDTLQNAKKSARHLLSG